MQQSNEEDLNMEELISILSETVEGVDFEKEQNLVDDKILNSMDIIEIVTTIGDELDVVIPAKEIIPENFNSVKSMWEMVQRLK